MICCFFFQAHSPDMCTAVHNTCGSNRASRNVKQSEEVLSGAVTDHAHGAGTGWKYQNTTFIAFYVYR